MTTDFISAIKSPMELRKVKESKQAKKTSTLILDAAERLVQIRGFNGFSYADISVELKIRKPSLHHHFQKKAALGKALIARYRENFLIALAEIDASTSRPFIKVERYVEIYAQVLKKNRMCLCGMLAAEYSTLPKEMQVGINQFFNVNEAWLAKTFGEGHEAKVFRLKGPAIETARFWISSLEGAMLVARSYRDPSRFGATASLLFGSILA